MQEVHRIPGITARFATPYDGLLRPADVEDTPPSLKTELPAAHDADISPSDRSIGQITDSNDHTQISTSPSEDDERPVYPRMSAHSSFTGGLSTPIQSPHFTTISPPQLHTPLPPAPPTYPSVSPLPNTDSPFVQHHHYPQLRKQVIPTYRGRTLREDLTGETPRFFDDAAVFAGRIVKEMETEQTLYQRFSRYGQIVSQLVGCRVTMFGTLELIS